MTPQERQLIDDLFDRLARLESAPRDPEAMAAIAQGLRQAPNAVYALVQTALVQDEALKRANDRIQQLEAAGGHEQSQSGGGFLDSMREAIFGQGQSQNQPRGSVPPVRPPEPTGRPVWNSGQVQPPPPGAGYGQPPYGQPGYGQPSGAPPFGGGGGSFLGTAAATAAGVIGGGMLLNSIRSMMGGHQAFADAGGLGHAGEGQRPWGDQSGSDLSREAGINDIGSSRGGRDDDQGSRAGLFDQASNEDNDDADGFDDDSGGDDDMGGDMGGGGDSDYA